MSLQTESHPPKIFTLIERLTIIQELIEELRPDNILKVLVNDDPMLPHAGNLFSTKENTREQNFVYTYELAGSKNLKRTQNNNLFQKLDFMHKSQLQKTVPYKNHDQSIPAPENKQSEQKNPSKSIDDNEKSMFRYFSENVRCFRCKKMGHHDFACLDEFSCFFCLSSEHHSEKCPQRFICFKCSRFGHVLSECPSREEAVVCHNCKRRHEDKCGFLLRGTENVKQVMIMDGLYLSDDIRCLKCLKYGHYNCEATEGTSAPFKRPYQTVNERREPRDKYFNPNKKHKY